MHISDLCSRDAITCTPQHSVAEAARLMRDHHVGDLIVVELREGRVTPVGIVTDRDIIVEVVSRSVDADSITAGDIMCTDLTTALSSEDVYDAIWHMRSRGIRRLPVVDVHGALVGVLTADDVTAFLAGELTELAHISPRQIKQEQVRRQAI
jgi:CBS domain-containing protein